MDNLPKTWDDWIENFKAWQDNVGYDREWMGDFDLSIQFDWERAGDVIEFGDYTGRAKWERSLQVPHQSMRDALVSMITVQGDTEHHKLEFCHDQSTDVPSSGMGWQWGMIRGVSFTA